VHEHPLIADVRMRRIEARMGCCCDTEGEGVGDHGIEWLESDDPSPAPSFDASPRHGPGWRVATVAVIAAVVAVGAVAATRHRHHRTPVAAVKTPATTISTIPMATLSPTLSTAVQATDTPFTTPTPPPLKSCESLVASALWEQFVLGDGCSVDGGKSVVGQARLYCTPTDFIVATTAPGSWFWGRTNGVFHRVAESSTDPSFTSAYRACGGLDATTCPTSTQALALISHGSDREMVVDSPDGYGCIGTWAYLNVHPKAGGNEGTDSLHFIHGVWLTGDRLNGCGDGVHPPQMPPTIAQHGCGN
jgi:hypothetical protein